MLEKWYEEGRTSGRYMVWDGDWIQGGRRNHGVPLGNYGMGLSHDYLMGNPSRGIRRDRYVVVHEALHIYANTTLAPRGVGIGVIPRDSLFGDFDAQGRYGRGWVFQMQYKCTSR